MRRIIATVLILSLGLTSNFSVANAAIKPGTSCKSQGSTSTSSGLKYTCIKKGNKLIWNNGVKIKSSDEGISVDKNVFSVDVTVPASFYEDQKLTQEELNADAAKKGYGRAKLNADGSVTFRMSKSQHQKALADMKKSVDDYIQETVNDSPKIFRKVTYNQNMTEFDISVNRAAFEDDLAAGMIGFGIGILSAFYQMFNGIKKYKTTINILDVATGKVFDTQTWPENG